MPIAKMYVWLSLVVVALVVAVAPARLVLLSLAGAEAAVVVLLTLPMELGSWAQLKPTQWARPQQEDRGRLAPMVRALLERQEMLAPSL